MSIGVVVKEVVVHPLRDLARDLSSSGSVEIGDRTAVPYPLERRKVGANFGDGGGFRLGNVGKTHGDLRETHS